MSTERRQSKCSLSLGQYPNLKAASSRLKARFSTALSLMPPVLWLSGNQLARRDRRMHKRENAPYRIRQILGSGEDQSRTSTDQETTHENWGRNSGNFS